MGTLVFFDLETGGTKWWPHRLNVATVPMNPIIQIAAIAVDEPTFEEIEVFERKIRFDPSHAELEALAMNSYNAETWEKEAVSDHQARRSFDSFLRRHASIEKVSRTGDPYQIASLAGHNAAAFDLPFLRAWYEQVGWFLPAAFQVLDTMILARLYSEITFTHFQNYKLQTLCESLGVSPGSHDALVDVRATVAIARQMLKVLRADF
jgi:DNA polymerase III epsilon subunit-like protein